MTPRSKQQENTIGSTNQMTVLDKPTNKVCDSDLSTIINRRIADSVIKNTDEYSGAILLGKNLSEQLFSKLHAMKDTGINDGFLEIKGYRGDSVAIDENTHRFTIDGHLDLSDEHRMVFAGVWVLVKNGDECEVDGHLCDAPILVNDAHWTEFVKSTVENNIADSSSFESQRILLHDFFYDLIDNLFYSVGDTRKSESEFN